ncbi:MAG: phytoene/squalene synthase family protein, partial [Hyphomicrobiales bacterium]
YAFNIETARVREQISQPLPGEIRLQWWRDRIEAGPDGEGGQGNPVAEALLDTIKRFELPIDAFERYLEARIFDLYDDPMPDRQAFEGYAGETASAIIVLAAMILAGREAAEVTDAAGHAGVAQAAVGAVRLLPIHRARRQVFFPADLLAAAGTSADDLLSEAAEPTLRAVTAMLALGRDHFGRYRHQRDRLPASVRAAFLPAEMTAVYLDRIAARGSAEIETPSRIGPLRRSFLYWRAMRR